eukprot:Platyproteum_vivax@DN10226_c0_g1_i1.p1
MWFFINASRFFLILLLLGHLKLDCLSLSRLKANWHSRAIAFFKNKSLTKADTHGYCVELFDNERFSGTPKMFGPGVYLDQLTDFTVKSLSVFPGCVLEFYANSDATGTPSVTVLPDSKKRVDDSKTLNYRSMKIIGKKVAIMWTTKATNSSNMLCVAFVKKKEADNVQFRLQICDDKDGHQAFVYNYQDLTMRYFPPVEENKNQQKEKNKCLMVDDTKKREATSLHVAECQINNRNQKWQLISGMLTIASEDPNSGKNDCLTPMSNLNPMSGGLLQVTQCAPVASNFVLKTLDA